MGNIKGIIGKIGLVAAALGIMSIVIGFFNYEIRIFKLLDYFGTTAGWVIKIALIIVGAALFFILGNGEEGEEESNC
jgi:hypothetical protein